MRKLPLLPLTPLLLRPMPLPPPPMPPLLRLLPLTLLLLRPMPLLLRLTPLLRLTLPRLLPRPRSSNRLQETIIASSLMGSMTRPGQSAQRSARALSFLEGQ
jgi:hypothetical protein